MLLPPENGHEKFLSIIEWRMQKEREDNAKMEFFVQ